MMAWRPSSQEAWPPLLSGSWPYLRITSRSQRHPFHFIEKSLADIPDSRMMAAPIGGVKHSAYQVARRVYVEDGLRGFTKGLVPVLLRAFPVNASALFVYEGLMKLLGAEKVWWASAICQNR